jgi:hypothetical protein
MVNPDRVVGLARVVLVAGLAGCGSPTQTVVPTPAPTATPTPVPVSTPTPEPTPTPGVEPPVTNTSPAARVTIRLYSIEDGAGSFFPNPDPTQPIQLRYWARVDVTSKDMENRETNGNGPVDFFVSRPRIVEMTGGHTNQRRLKALEPAAVEVWATQDGIRSNTLTLTFK